MKIPAIGDLKRRVLLHKAIEQPFGSSALETVYQGEHTLWAAIEPVSGVVFWGSKQVNEEVSHRITLRYRAGVTDPASITGQHELVCDGLRYRAMRATDLNGLKRFTVIEAKQLDSQ